MGVHFPRFRTAELSSLSDNAGFFRILKISELQSLINKTFVWYFVHPVTANEVAAPERSDDRENPRAHRSSHQVSRREDSTASISMAGTHLHRFGNHRELGQTSWRASRSLFLCRRRNE